MLLALIGWLISTKKYLGHGLKSLITVGYLVFAFMNIMGLWGSYTFAEAIRQDLLIAATAAPDTLQNAQAVLAKWSFVNQRTLALMIHVILGMFVLCVIWFGRFGEPDTKNDLTRKIRPTSFVGV